MMHFFKTQDLLFLGWKKHPKTATKGVQAAKKRQQEYQ